MNASFSILHICNEVGLGGTERGIISMCRAMGYGVFEHTVHCLIRPGARAGELAGFAAVHCDDAANGALAALCSERKFHAAVLHRAGGAEPRWSDVLRTCKRAGIDLVIEINIFGLVDQSPEDEIIDWHLHISKSSYCSFRERAEDEAYPRLDRHRVLYIPVEIGNFVAAGSSPARREAARAQLGFAPDDFVLLRTGRADFRKWGDLLMFSVAETLRCLPRARFIFLSAPASRAWYLRHVAYADRVTVLPPTSDNAELERAYAAADVYTHSSRRGESLGVSLIEAMASGLPVVVNATPWRDNAQIEVVDHLRTGLIANSPASFAGAISHLFEHPELRRQMGVAGRDKAIGTYDAQVVCLSLARLIGASLRARGIPCPDAPELHGELLPTRSDIEVFWSRERAQREEANWQNVKPRRIFAPARQMAWGMVDRAQWLGQRLGFLA